MQTSTVDTQLTVDTLVAATVDTQTSTVDTQLTVDTLDAVTVDTQISTAIAIPTNCTCKHRQWTHN